MDILNEWDPEFAASAPPESHEEPYGHYQLWDESCEQESQQDTPVHGSSRSTSLTQHVLDTVRATLKALDGRPVSHVMPVLSRMTASPRVMAMLGPDMEHTYEGVREVLEHEATVASSGNLNLTQLPILSEYQDAVAAEIAEIAAVVPTGRDPHALWSDLVESVQRRSSRKQLGRLVSAIDEKEPVEVLMGLYGKLEPPTTRKALTRVGGIRTARQLLEDHRSASAGTPARRFSCGLPTLDVGYTGVGEERGLVAGGQFLVVMGPTGTGKTSFTNSVTPAFGLDLINWGLKDAYQVVFHTEEESIDKLRGFRMDAGQRFHALADNVVIDAIGTSRRRMAETLYDLVIAADEWSRATRRPIVEKLPYIVQVDYIQSIQEAGEDPTTATAITAEFLLRGVAAWNPEEMEKFSGVSFREYAGMAWPDGMEHHRVAVVAYAQLVKISDETLYYKADKRGVQISDFALLDDRDEPMWDVREGDLRLFGKNQMRGSGVIAQNAHAILILHRSVPYNNPARRDENGELHLTDTRARILFDKSRSGSQIAYAPMRFDVQSTGFRAQYFDDIAERAVAAGKLSDYDELNYLEPGDPLVPKRPTVDPLAQFRY